MTDKAKDLARWTGPDKMQLVWDECPREDWQFLAMGNGHIGVAAFMPDGLIIQINAIDNWNDKGELLPIARWHIAIDGQPFDGLQPFKAWTDLRNGLLVFTAGGDTGVKIVLRVQRDLDLVIADLFDHRPRASGVEMWIETFRTSFERAGSNTDTEVLTERNETSTYKELCAAQKMVEWAENHPDPWLGWGTALALDCREATSRQGDRWVMPPANRRRLMLAVHIGRGERPELASAAKAVLAQADKRGDDSLDAAHQQAWQNFWNGPFVRIDSDNPEYKAIEASWYLWRFYLQGCASGPEIASFAGGNYLYSTDYPTMRGPEWIWEARLLYWPTLKSGDYDLLHNFFRFWVDSLPFQVERIRKWHDHNGAIFPETMHRFGGLRWDDIDPAKHSLPNDFNQYIRWDYSGTLELLLMMVHFYRHTNNGGFVDQYLQPVAREVARFYLEHFPREANGQLRLEPAQCMERWFDVVNPISDIAGLMAILPPIIELAEKRNWDDHIKKDCEELLSILPELPRGYCIFKNGRIDHFEKRDGQQLLPCAELKDTREMNEEDPELAPIFPFEVFGLDRPELHVAINTYRARLLARPERIGPSQTALFAARLGLVRDAILYLRAHRRQTQCFPSGITRIYGGRRNTNSKHPDLSKTPVLDSLSEIAMTLQEMLLQETPAGVRTLPAWDLEIPVRFRLRTAHAGWVEMIHRRPGDTWTRTEKPIMLRDGNVFNKGDFLERSCGRLAFLPDET